ncbi:MAG: ExbD/TolR family protein [Gammaproteobacteria bacterium]
MSMQLPDEDQGGELSEINVTPLVDVMLVLLIVFIVTAPLLTQEVKVKLPKTEQTAPTPNKHMAILAVTAGGEAMLDDKAIPLPNLEDELKALHERDPDIEVQLQADRAAIFDSVAKVMASAQRSGIGKLSFVTVEQ